MPYEISKENGKYCVKKKSGAVLHCYDDEGKAKDYMAALYANVKDSDIAEASLIVTKASFDKSELDPNKKRRIMMVNSDTAPDLYEESMSLELFNDFCHRIENKTPIPEVFKSSVCEDFWCGGMPYVSIAHYPAGKDGKNVPGMPESVYVDGKMLKSKAYLHDNELGRRLFDALCKDLDMKSKGTPNDQPVRVSIGFLDLEHEHVFEGKTITFTRVERGQVCPLCKDGHGSKIYKKGHLVHLAATRVPVNPRTEMSLEEKSMGEIITKKDDAASIIGEDLAEDLEAKSLADDVLVVKAEGIGTQPADIPAGMDDGLQNNPTKEAFAGCYDPNTDSFDQNCINISMAKFMVEMRNSMNTVKSFTDEVKKSLNVADDFVEEAQRRDVSEADKKHAEKEYGDVKYADESNKKYPIDTREHVRAALSYWGMPKNREKYSPEEQKKISGRIHAAAKKFGIDVSNKSSVVEESMEPKTNDKAEKEGVAEDEKETQEEEKGKSLVTPLDTAFENLKSLLGTNPTAEQVQSAFNSLGQEVEKSYVPPAPNANDIAAIVKSAVEAAITPLNVELATLKARIGSVDSVSRSNANLNPVSRALSLKPVELLEKSSAQKPTRKLTQIEKIARASTGASVE